MYGLNHRIVEPRHLEFEFACIFSAYRAYRAAQETPPSWIFSEYRVASYIRYTATLDLLPLKLLFPRTALPDLSLTRCGGVFCCVTVDQFVHSLFIRSYKTCWHALSVLSRKDQLFRLQQLLKNTFLSYLYMSIAPWQALKKGRAAFPKTWDQLHVTRSVTSFLVSDLVIVLAKLCNLAISIPISPSLFPPHLARLPPSVNNECLASILFHRSPSLAWHRALGARKLFQVNKLIQV